MTHAGKKHRSGAESIDSQLPAHRNWATRQRSGPGLLPGRRRRRPDPERLRVGDVVDWWRVEAYEPNRRLRLAAEMRLPGRAWLEFEVTQSNSGSTIRQTAIYDPVGLGGLAYWYSLYPVHQLVFGGMLRRIAKAAIGQTNRSVPPHRQRSDSRYRHSPSS